MIANPVQFCARRSSFGARAFEHQLHVAPIELLMISEMASHNSSGAVRGVALRLGRLVHHEVPAVRERSKPGFVHLAAGQVGGAR